MFTGNRTQVIWEKVAVGVKNILFNVNVLLKKRNGEEGDSFKRGDITQDLEHFQITFL